MRRKFDEALTSLEPGQRIGSKAEEGLSYCNELFALEREFARLESRERHKARDEHSKPIAEAFFAWVCHLNALPKSALGKACEYARGQNGRLMNVYLDGRLELSNNRAERSIKPFVIGRKNWLFCNSSKGAKASSIVYSIIETAKENGLKPFEYLKFLLETVPSTKTTALDSLLPWGDAVPEICKSPKI